MNNKFIAAIVLAGAAWSPAIAQSSGETGASIEIRVEGLRSSKGVTRIALCRPAPEFPDCRQTAARNATVSITDRTATVRFDNLPAGTYAVSVFHDANGNGRLDTFAGVPREGYGFSRNPPFRPRAPTFSEAAIQISGEVKVAISLRYLL